MERSFGDDIRGIRIHTDARASAACEALGVAGFAVGDDLAFRAPPSRWLLGHEMAHALQQRTGGRARDAVTDLEGEADRAATRAVAGDSAQVGGHADPGQAQAFQIDAAAQAKFPRTTAYTRDELPKVPNDARVFKAVVDAGQTTEAKARAGFPWGAGPRLVPKDLPSKREQGGGHDPGSNDLKIHEGTLKKWEAETDAGLIEGYEFTFETTVLHEFVHFLGDGREKMTEEWGKDFEEKALGNWAAPRDAKWNLEHFLRPSFTSGDYEVKVTGKDAAFQQRFRIVGSDSGDGTYDGVVGKTVTVSMSWGAGKQWQLFIDHNDGTSGWKQSKMRKIDLRGLTDQWLIQSEDWTDRDYNDLEITVTRTSSGKPPPAKP